MRNLQYAPDEVFDWFQECVAEGYYPSQEDFIDEFGTEYEEWCDGLSYTREEILDPIEDEINPRSEHEQLRERGLDLKRDFL